jgi:hypothetical protein
LESRISPCSAGYSQRRRDRGDDATLASRWAILPCLLLGLAAVDCTTNPKGNVEDDWDKAIHDLGMSAVYPIDEDVQVDDIFLFAPTANDAGDTHFRLTRIVSVMPCDCLVDALRLQQAKRQHRSASAIYEPA